jgi:hypothetical protein
MPIVNTYYSSEKQKQLCLKFLDELKSYVADLLTYGDIGLKSNEISIRLIETSREGMIADGVELEIFAHAFEDRVKRQDNICLQVREYMMKIAPELGDVRVWLVLSELGHSWD